MSQIPFRAVEAFVATARPASRLEGALRSLPGKPLRCYVCAPEASDTGIGDRNRSSGQGAPRMRAMVRLFLLILLFFHLFDGSAVVACILARSRIVAKRSRGVASNADGTVHLGAFRESFAKIVNVPRGRALPSCQTVSVFPRLFNGGPLNAP